MLICVVIEQVAEISPMVAIISAEPSLIAETKPFESTVANHLDFYYPEASARGSDYFSVVHEKLLSVFSAMDHLKSWCGWLSVREDALGIGLKNVINAVESGKVRIDEL